MTRAWERKLRAFQEERESVNEEEMILSGELEQFRSGDVLGEKASAFHIDCLIPDDVDDQGRHMD